MADKIEELERIIDRLESRYADTFADLMEKDKELLEAQKQIIVLERRIEILKCRKPK